MASPPSDLPFPPYLGEGSEVLNFKYVENESLMEAWDRLLVIQERANPKCHAKLLLRSFYVGLPLFHRCVLDSLFEKDFLGNKAFQTYEKMKIIFGQPKVETMEPTVLVSHHQTELIKETKATMETDFKGLYNMTTKINGNVVLQNKRLDTLDQKIDSLSVLKNEMKILNGKFGRIVKDDNA